MAVDQAFAPFVPPLTIEVTSYCNLKCPYCANPTLKRGYGEMPTEMIYRLADECARDGYRVMAVHGIGEPLLRKDLEVILARFTELRIWNGWIASNGTLLSTKRMEALAAAGVKGIYISLDTLDANIYRRTRAGKLAKVIANVQSAAHLFPSVEFLVGLMNHKEQIVDSSVLDAFYSQFRGLKNVHHHAYDNFRFPHAAEDWQRVDPATGEKALIDDCDQWSHHFTIGIDGRVAVCCVDQEGEHIVGDVTKDSIRDIWLAESTQNVMRSIALGLHDSPAVCHKCVLKPSKRQLSDADPLIAGSYYGLRKAADTARAAGDIPCAVELLRHMKRRNPWDATLAAEIVALMQKPEPTIFEIAAAERASRSEMAALR